jgi:hypothetical protein
VPCAAAPLPPSRVVAAESPGLPATPLAGLLRCCARPPPGPAVSLLGSSLLALRLGLLLDTRTTRSDWKEARNWFTQKPPDESCLPAYGWLRVIIVVFIPALSNRILRRHTDAVDSLAPASRTVWPSPIVRQDLVRRCHICQHVGAEVLGAPQLVEAAQMMHDLPAGRMTSVALLA